MRRCGILRPCAPIIRPMPLAWDLFCRVIDNFGDIGVCWRLAADLARRAASGAPVGRRPVGAGLDGARGTWASCPVCRCCHWADAARDEGRAWRRGGRSLRLRPATGLSSPRMAGALPAARRSGINLEYLSAEAWAKRSHGLPSPQLSRARNGASDKWFFYPGFESGHRRPDARSRACMEREQARFDRSARGCRQGSWHRGPASAGVSLFCYATRRRCPRSARRRWRRTDAAAGARPAARSHQVLTPCCPHGAGSLRQRIELPWFRPARLSTVLLWSLRPEPSCAARIRSCAPCGPAGLSSGRSTPRTMQRPPCQAADAFLDRSDAGPRRARVGWRPLRTHCGWQWNGRASAHAGVRCPGCSAVAGPATRLAQTPGQLLCAGRRSARSCSELRGRTTLKSSGFARTAKAKIGGPQTVTATGACSVAGLANAI